jgi:YD repeat-containing protein
VDATSTEIFRYNFDPNGRLTNRWTAAKGNTVYRYDALGNLTNVDYAVSPDLTMQYDALNRLTNMVDAVGTNVYTYDGRGGLCKQPVVSVAAGNADVKVHE